MKLNTYLNFNGNCQEAFEYYAAHLGATAQAMLTYEQVPSNPQPPPELKGKVMHARIRIGDAIVMASDVPPGRHQGMRGAYLSIAADDDEQAERFYNALSEGAEVFQAMQETFFAHRFAMLRDCFGTNWMILHERTPENTA